MTHSENPLHALEQALAELGPQMQRAVPEQYAKARKLVAAMRAGESRLPEVRALSLELLRWQLGLQRAEFERQRQGLAVLLARGEPSAVAADQALAAALELLDRSLAATRTPDRAPSAAELGRVKALAADFETRAVEAAIAASNSTAGVTLRPLAKQPSVNGVSLRPVAPASPPRAPLAAFKLRPGAARPPVGR